VDRYRDRLRLARAIGEDGVELSINVFSKSIPPPFAGTTPRRSARKQIIASKRKYAPL
jgi:hypothetical protein